MTEIPDHVPAGMSLAEGYQFLSDALRNAQQSMSDDELREFVGRFADDMEKLARALRGRTEGDTQP